MDKPTDVFDRDEEWADLVDFATSPLPPACVTSFRKG